MSGKINERLFIELYNSGKDDLELSNLFGVSERTIQRYGRVLRKKGKINYRQELSDIFKRNKNNIRKKDMVKLCKVIGDNLYKSYKTINIREPKAKKNTKKREEISILDISDIHRGMINEVFDSNKGEKIITYNENIFKKEMKVLINSVSQIHKILSHSYNLKKLVINILGDIVTNDRIFPEQAFEIEKVVGLQVFDMVNYFTKMIVEFLRLYKEVEVVGMVGNHGRCFDKETRILTNQGWKFYDEIGSREIVATYNIQKDQIEWQQITDKYVYFNEPRLINFKSEAIAITTTPDHELVTKTSKNNIIKQHANNLINNSSINIPATATSNIEDYDISDNELKLLAWILTDGSRDDKHGYLQIHQSKKPTIKIIRNLLNTMNINYVEDVRSREAKIIKGKKVLKNRPSYTFRILAKDSKKLNEKFEFKSKKDIPNWCWKLSDRQVQVFLNSLLLGDGTVRDKDKVLYGKKDFLEKIQSLLITHNILSTLNKNNRGDYYLQIRYYKQYNITNGGQIVDYNDTVWCVSVPNGTIIVEKNGKPFICGNSNPHHYSEPVQNNFEYFLYKMLQKQFADSKRVNIIVPESRRYVHKILGWKHLLEHGDSMRGSSDSYIEKQIKDLSLNMGGFDVLHYAHFHKLKEREIADKVIVKQNGCWIEKDSYAFKKFKTYSVPKQHFFGCNSKRPETWSYKIDLRG